MNEANVWTEKFVLCLWTSALKLVLKKIYVFIIYIYHFHAIMNFGGEHRKENLGFSPWNMWCEKASFVLQILEKNEALTTPAQLCAPSRKYQSEWSLIDTLSSCYKAKQVRVWFMCWLRDSVVCTIPLILYFS